MIKNLYQLTKPGLVYGNLITAAAGFFLVAGTAVSWPLLIASLLGLGLIIASAGVFNNYYDRGLDAKMSRTKNRPLVTGAVSPGAALAWGLTLLILGLAILSGWAGRLPLEVAILGFVIYVFCYTPLKHKSAAATLVGSLAGATPILTGYTAISGRLDGGALILFLVLACWQMPHFYAIAIYRLNDYAAGGVPVLPVKQGIAAARRQMLAYWLAFMLACLALAYFGYAGKVYAAGALLLGLLWLWQFRRGFAANAAVWARRLFLYSLVVLTGLSIFLALGNILP
ncbi:MAG TPA: heme o synthase [Patescibacteria group bacterium]|nr:heme o synthase [Patescibacteria group bacterium]